MCDIHKAVEDWAWRDIPVEDPIINAVMVKPGLKLEVNGRCGARDGNYGARFYRNLSYDIVDNKVRVYDPKKKEA